MTPQTTQSCLAELKPIGLAELELDAPLLTRTERKYLVSPRQLYDVANALCSDLKVLVIDDLSTFRYETCYFDTPELITYMAAAHRRPARFKVRTRSYLDSGLCRLEIKQRDRTGQTIKQRLDYPLAQRSHLAEEALAYLSQFDQTSPVSRDLDHVLTTRYRRNTLVEKSSASRITVDDGFACSIPGGAWLNTPDLVFVETKTVGPPCAFDRLLWAGHARPVTVSKYGVGMASLVPDLPTSKWSRVLRAYFGTQRKMNSTLALPAEKSADRIPEAAVTWLSDISNASSALNPWTDRQNVVVSGGRDTR